MFSHVICVAKCLFVLFVCVLFTQFVFGKQLLYDFVVFFVCIRWCKYAVKLFIRLTLTMCVLRLSTAFYMFVVLKLFSVCILATCV